MRGRIWIFAALVAAALALHLVLLSAKIAQNGEDTIRSHVALSTGALRSQLELLDARLSPRAVAAVPELIEATRPPADPTEAVTRPDDKALRAAASALSPEPDLLAVLNRQGAIVSRRAKSAQALDDAGKVPLAKAALEGNPAAAFASFDGVTYRVAAARIPGNGAAAVVGTLVDDRFAAQLKSQVDADVTLIQGSKVLASSLPQGEERARLLRWAAAPAPGYGVLQIWLPGLENKLSGKLPWGTTRYAVRGALVPIDSGVTAALTVPAAPYFAWFGRYQAFYLAAFALFLLFSLIWVLTARAPKVRAATREEPLPPRAPRPSPSLDVGQPGSTPPPADDVPWAAAEVLGLHASEPKVVSRAPSVESLDPDEPPPVAKEAASDHAMWASDPVTPASRATEEKPQEMTAEEAGLVDAAPESPVPPPPLDAELPMPSPPPAEETASSAAKGDFSFADLLDDAHRAPAPPQEEALARDFPDTTAAGGPSEELLAESRGRNERPFPGEEPTRVEPVSAALLEKMREPDEETPSRPFGSLVPEENAPPAMEQAPEANVTMQDFSMPEVPAEDPDEQHWRETFDKFKELKAQLGEPADRISFEKFATKLRKNRADLLAKHKCRGVRFSVYEKDGKAAIKASAIR
ncbi:MAG: MXAN_5187 C-terminal domain-containing protein [Myxococcales bacterium]|nr:hypothetical protein [Myxococcales bacterium]